MSVPVKGQGKPEHTGSPAPYSGTGLFVRHVFVSYEKEGLFVPKFISKRPSLMDRALTRS